MQLGYVIGCDHLHRQDSDQMTLEWWHLGAVAGAYLAGVSTNVVAAVLQRFLHRRTGWWWLEP